MDFAQDDRISIPVWRTAPPVCLLVALMRLMFGWLRSSREHIGKNLYTEDGIFRPFRQISDVGAEDNGASCVFSVRFKFAMLTEKQNRRASVLPMMLIAGFPGFRSKVYSSAADGRWMGLYQWASPAYIESYRRSWVYTMMNRRAVPGSVFEAIHMEESLLEIINHWSVASDQHPGKPSTGAV